MHRQRRGQSPSIRFTGPLPETMAFSLQPLKPRRAPTILDHKGSLKNWARLGIIVTAPSTHRWTEAWCMTVPVYITPPKCMIDLM